MNLLKRTYRLLIPQERREAARVVGVVFLTALLDFVGIASLLPILYLLLEKDGDRTTVLLFCLLAFVVVVLKGWTATGLLKVQHRFLLSLYKRLSLALYSSYYKKGLLYIRERGAGRLSFEVNNVCFGFSQGVLMPLLRMASDAMLLLLTTVAFLLYDGATMLLLYSSFIPFVVIYLLVVRKRISQYGRDEQEARREQIRVVNDTFRGYVDAEVYGAFPSLWRNFARRADYVSERRMQMMNMQRIPMVLSELSVVIGLALLAFTGEGDMSLLTGAFALVALRLLPALRGLLTGWTQISHAEHFLEIIEDGLVGTDSEQVETTSGCLTFEKEITLSNLSFAYEEGNEVVKNFSTCIQKGEFVGISGQSGVGKTTLFNLLLGFLNPQNGNIRVDDVPLSAKNRQAWLNRIGYVPQEVFIFDTTLAANVALGEDLIDQERVREVLVWVALDEWVKGLPQGLDTPMNEAGSRLSGGQKQRLGMARALYKRADVLLLDEAASALDFETEKEINDTIRRIRQENEGLTILYIAHHASALSVCDRIIEI